MRSIETKPGSVHGPCSVSLDLSLMETWESGTHPLSVRITSRGVYFMGWPPMETVTLYVSRDRSVLAFEPDTARGCKVRHCGNKGTQAFIAVTGLINILQKSGVVIPQIQATEYDETTGCHVIRLMKN